MKNTSLLELALIAAALGQFAIALLNLNLVRIMNWKPDLDRMSVLVREVFHVHAWFISITLALFSVLTIRFASEIPVTEMGRWLAAGIAFFWGIRTVIQVAYYSGSHWRGQPARLAVHLVLLAVYGGFTLVYAIAALAP